MSSAEITPTTAPSASTTGSPLRPASTSVASTRRSGTSAVTHTTSRVISVETGAITNPLKLQSKGDDVLGLIAQLSTKLNTELKLPALPRQTGDAGTRKPAAPAAPAAGRELGTQKLDVKTALLYSKALDEQDSGHPKQAAELYRAVLQKFPDFGPAQQNLAKVQSSGD